MPTEPLPINFGSNKDIEDVCLEYYGASAIDVYFDSNGNVVRRPGLTAICNLGVAAGIDGLYWWDRQERVVAVSGGRAFEITDVTGTSSERSGQRLLSGHPVYWGDFGTSLYAANGGDILKIPSSGSTTYVASPAPTTASHIAVIDDTLMALSSNTQQVHYATTGTPDSWPGAWISAVSQPDLLKAMGVSGDVIELFGTSTIEGWRNDGSTPFVRDSQFTIDSGISAPHSARLINGIWYWLDHERKVVRLTGGGIEGLSMTLNKYIQGFSFVSDAIGGETVFDGRPQYILTFPTEDKTIAFDIYNGFWSRLGKWRNSAYERFAGQSFCHAIKWGISLVGDRSTSTIYKLDSTTYEDNGGMLRSMVRTPTIHWGMPDKWKRSKRLDVYLKKTSSAIDIDTAQMFVRWRDQGKPGWKSGEVVSLGQVGDTEFHGKIGPMGSYKTRQYEFVLMGASPLVFSKAMETFRVK